MTVEQIAEMLDLQGQIVPAAQRRHLVKRLRMAKRQIDRMERPETASVGNDAGMGVFGPHQRQHLVEHMSS